MIIERVRPGDADKKSRLISTVVTENCIVMKHNDLDRRSVQFLTLVSYPFEIERRGSQITSRKRRSESRPINLTRQNNVPFSECKNAIPNKTRGTKPRGSASAKIASL